MLVLKIVGSCYIALVIMCWLGVPLVIQWFLLLSWMVGYIQNTHKAKEHTHGRCVSKKKDVDNAK